MYETWTDFYIYHVHECFNKDICFYSHIPCLFYCIDNNNESISDITHVSYKLYLGLDHTKCHIIRKNYYISFGYRAQFDGIQIYHIFINFIVFYHQTYIKIITTWNAFCIEVFVFRIRRQETSG